jgi:hypothetical protein
MSDMHPDGDRLVTLALDDLGESDRTTVLTHLADCRRCRGEYDELSSTIERTLAAAPSVQPSPGFDRRVLEAMGFDQPAARLPSLPGWRAFAAGIAAGLAVGMGGTYAVTEVLDGSDGNGGDGLVAQSAYLTTDDGEHVGTVTRAGDEPDSPLVVSITDGPPGKRYTCVLRLDNGRERVAGAWTLDSASGSWVVPYPSAGIASVELVTDEGNVWSTADL